MKHASRLRRAFVAVAVVALVGTLVSVAAAAKAPVADEGLLSSLSRDDHRRRLVDGRPYTTAARAVPAGRGRAR